MISLGSARTQAGEAKLPSAAAALLAVTALLAVPALLLGQACSAPRRSDRPSIVLITIDTVRADHLSCYGYFRRTTPILDRFAAEAVLFENAVTPMATTLPAHVSLMTSTYPLQHGIKGNFEHLAQRFKSSEGLRTIAEMLQAKGFTTAAFVSASPVKRSSGLDSGFSTFDEPEGAERDAAATTDRILRWLDRRTDEPFFLWIHYFDPHGPYAPPETYRIFKADEQLRRYLTTMKFPDPDDSTVLRDHDLYDGEILFMDEQIGRVLDRLRALGLYERAAIVVAGDHGEGLGQHGWKGHGHIYNEQLFVPLLLRFPDSMRIAPARKTGFAELVDVLPTLTARGILPLDTEDFGQFEGLDLLDDRDPPPVAGPAAGAGRAAEDPATAVGPGRYLLSERVNRERGWEPGFKYCLVGPSWKYVHLTEGHDELYDMQRDREETTNVIDLYPEIARDLRTRLLGQIAFFEKRSKKRGAAGVPDEVLKELESLGYVK